MIDRYITDTHEEIDSIATLLRFVACYCVFWDLRTDDVHSFNSDNPCNHHVSCLEDKPAEVVSDPGGPLV